MESSGETVEEPDERRQNRCRVESGGGEIGNTDERERKKKIRVLIVDFDKD